MNTRVVGAVMVGMAALLACFVLVPAALDKSPHPIVEDDPDWECATDGNRLCGPSVYEQVKRAQCDVWLVTSTGGGVASDSQLATYAACVNFEEG